MTYRELYARIDGPNAAATCHIGNCPDHWMKDHPRILVRHDLSCPTTGNTMTDDCAACWDREIPEKVLRSIPEAVTTIATITVISSEDDWCVTMNGSGNSLLNGLLAAVKACAERIYTMAPDWKEGEKQLHRLQERLASDSDLWDFSKAGADDE